jgi:nucleoside-diphosphate-sugar epimerase
MSDNRPAILLDSAQAQWKWTHEYVENVAEAVALAVTDERAAGKIYNVGEMNTPTVSERIRQVGEVAGWQGEVVSLPLEKLPAHLRPPYQPTQDLVMDSARIRNELGFIAIHSPGEGLRRTIDWERRNPWPSDPGADEYAVEDSARADYST